MPSNEVNRRAAAAAERFIAGLDLTICETRLFGPGLREAFLAGCDYAFAECCRYADEVVVERAGVKK